MMSVKNIFETHSRDWCLDRDKFVTCVTRVMSATQLERLFNLFMHYDTTSFIFIITLNVAFSK